MERNTGRKPLSVGSQGNEKFTRSEDHGEELLPGIPNDIAFVQIVPRLPWTAFHALSAVSPCWRQAIQSHTVYNARIRSHVTETFVVICHTHPDRVLDENTGEVVHGIALYCLRNRSFRQLPAIPHFRRGIPRACQCISLDGKIYVLGGAEEPNKYPNTTDAYDRGSAEVYVLDLAGQREWKQCANMQEPRLSFGCGVLNGKIYVLGGISDDNAVHVSEVYDPRENVWSSIKPMIALRFDHGVSTLGEELFVHGGYYCGPEYMADDEPIANRYDKSFFLEVYHPGKNEWRMVGPCGLKNEKRLFLADEKFHFLQWNGVCVLEMDEDRQVWTDLKPVLISPIGESVWGPSCIGPTVLTVEPRVITAVNDVYLVLVDYYTHDAEYLHEHGGDPYGLEDDNTCLVQSKRIGPDDGSFTFGLKFVWEKVNCPLSFERLDAPFMCPIQL